MRSLLALLLMLFPLFAVADYDEDVDGDLSDDQFAPTLIELEPGTNLIAATNFESPLERDFFTIAIADNQFVSSIQLTEYVLLTQPSDGGSLIAIEEGPVVSDLLGGVPFRGLAIVGVGTGVAVGDELLDDLGGAPITPGVYSFWVQNTGSDTDYTLAIELEQLGSPGGAIPVPTLGWPALLLLMLGLLIVAIRRF
ncbi:MAG: hypothetical protein AAGH65_08715 [Pseudomonadota bacterium]